MNTKFRSIVILMLMMLSKSSGQERARHIVFILADDLGWNDVGFHNPDMITPNIDELARQGVILKSSYVQPVCTPSRHSLMTGIYPFKAGLQGGTIKPGEAECSPLSMQFFPKKLQKLGYSTHIVGKWHLGFCNVACTPTRRGFDSFLGFYSGMEDYYSKTRDNGVDFNDGIDPIPADERYSTVVYAERAKEIIDNHNQTKPMFLYLPFQSVHNPIQVPKRFVNMYNHIANDVRRQYSGMVSAMDEAIGNVTQALSDNGMIKDTLIIFTSDNGGWPGHGGNNFPLRGGKITVFEGGTRAAAFVSGSGIEKNGSTYDGLIHAVDWHPTILSAAGYPGEYKDDTIDGLDQWKAISTGAESARKEFVYNLDDSPLPKSGHAAIRVGDYKLITGFPGPYQDWYKPEQEIKGIGVSAFPDISRILGRSTTKWPGEGLYNLKHDPTEHNDISKDFPEIVRNLTAKLNEYRKAYVKPYVRKTDPNSNPDNYGGHWMPGWC